MNSDSKTFIGCEIVTATPITISGFNSKYGMTKDIVIEHWGYEVEHSDGTIRFIPNHVFMKTYRSVTTAEAHMILGE